MNLKQLDTKKVTAEMRQDPNSIYAEEGKSDLNQTVEHESTTGISHSEGLERF